MQNNELDCARQFPVYINLKLRQTFKQIKQIPKIARFPNNAEGKMGSRLKLMVTAY